MAQSRQIAESEGSEGKLGESLEKQVLAELEAHTPWNVIAKKYRISTKTIAKIREKRLGAGDEGEVAAEVFELFKKGVTPAEVVIRLKLPPKVVKELFEEFKEMTEHHNRICSSCYTRALNTFKQLYAGGVIFYPCRICGKDMVWHLDREEDRRQIISILERGGIRNWYHTGCKKD